MKEEFSVDKVFVCRLPHDGDLLLELNKICTENDIKCGFISVIGALKCLKLSFYEQDNKKYVDLNSTDVNMNDGMEIVSATGNISIKEGKPFVHIHVIASDKNGKCVAGHLANGSKIFAGEAIIQKFEGKEYPVREFDEVTKLTLWKE